MSLIAMVFGVLLMLLGGGLYLASDPRAATALIPAYFGIALVVLGVVARNEKFRMHAMHVAALLGLVGLAFPAYRVIKGLLIINDLVVGEKPSELSILGQTAMSVLCAVFLGLCVKSFIDSRKARKRGEAEAQAQGS